MPKVHILAEGQTEETIARDIITPYLESRNWVVNYSIIKTSNPADRPAHRGGVTSWGKVEKEIRGFLGDSSLAAVTTMLDFYGFPDDAPGMASRPAGPPLDRVRHVEEALYQHFGDRRFIPHLILHETEAWVFAAGDQLAELYIDRDPMLGARLAAEVSQAGSAEEINDSRDTAPSKRLERLCPGYAKVFDGPLAISELGLDALRARCPHLNAWLRRF